MKSKFAEVVQEAQSELLEQQGANQFNPDEVEGIMRWAAQGDPNTFKQFDGQQGDQYVGSMVNAYRTAQQADPNAQQGQADPNAQQGQVDPNAPAPAPVTGTQPSTANAPTV